MIIHSLKYYQSAISIPTTRIVFLIFCQFTLLAPLAKADTREATEEKISYLSKLITAEPERASLYLQRADAHYLLNNLDKAITDYSSAIRIDDRQDEAYFGRGMALGRQGLIREGIAELSVYLQRHPDSSVAYTKRGVRYIWISDFDSAARDLTTAIELNHNNAEAHDDLGVIYAKKGNNSLAAKHFQMTIQLDPTYQKAYHNLALVYHLSGHSQEALDILNAGLTLNPDNRNSMILKSSILSTLGREEEAKVASNIAEFLPDGNWSEHTPVQ
jgi:tetratricopeptide (TPR) repeat protein